MLAPSTLESPVRLPRGAARVAPIAGQSTSLVSAHLVPLDGGQLWATHGTLATLQAAQLATFAQMMADNHGQCLRRLPDRENWRLELAGPAAAPRAAYLKKHRPRNSWWMHCQRWRPWRSAGWVEAENVLRLAAAGVPTMHLLAVGEQPALRGQGPSFVLTESLEGHTQLDHFLRQRFATAIAGRRQSHDLALSRLLVEVAALARRFHQAGFNHRDFYCCHFFVAEPAAGRFAVRLIDLQRVERRRWLRHRWLVKDLAQLAYSAPRDRITRTRRLAFLRHYLGIARLAPPHKRLIRAVLAKQQAMQARLGAHP